ncbi:LacI family DNA-binding transcriptional regulator [Pseudonocardia sp. CA-107938]|uniref:LacI family DNA-binding transcriptional regulator n=1 Tax=Pseudonocardia sp. CA-107938 TaxID=3240021 RepID=UPI003D8C0DF2
MRRPASVTLAHIAASAGVSVPTVSKVVNGRGDVAPDTRALIEDLLRQHQYVPRSTRRALSTSTVELLIRGVFGGYVTAVIEGAVHAAAETGVSVVVNSLDAQRTDDPTPTEWANRFTVTGRTGVVVVSGDLTRAHIDAMTRAAVPLVLIDPLNTPGAEVPSVGSTNFAGGMSATQHLVELGHRRIAYIGGPATSGCNQARAHGYRAALESAGIPNRPEYVLNDDFHYDVGRRHGGHLLDLPEPPTAIVGGCDTIAIGIMEAARVRGLRIPEDLSITGFDDVEVATVASPPLTVIRQPLREMGRVALRSVLQLAAGATLDSHHVELATELVVRGTTAPPSRP